MGGQPVPDENDLFPGIEDFDLLEDLDQGDGVVAARFEVEAQPRTAAGVRGVPTIRVDGRLFYGDDRLEDAAASAPA